MFVLFINRYKLDTQLSLNNKPKTIIITVDPLVSLRITCNNSTFLYFIPKDLSCTIECTSKAMNVGAVSSALGTSLAETCKETFACHLCHFDADR
jgi:hypothetical protein